MALGWADLVLTAVLHEQGQIVELNPLMRPLLERGEWLFAAVKASTLLALWVVMAKQYLARPQFVRQMSAWGCVAYLTLWAAFVQF